MANCSQVSFDTSSVTCAPNGEVPTTSKPREIAICLSTNALLLTDTLSQYSIAPGRFRAKSRRQSWVEPGFSAPHNAERLGLPTTLPERKKIAVSRLNANRVLLRVPIRRRAVFNRDRNADFARSVVNAWTPRLKPCGLGTHSCGPPGRRQSRRGCGADGDAGCSRGARAHGRAPEDAEAIYSCGRDHERRRSRLRREGNDRGKHYLPRDAGVRYVVVRRPY